MARRIVESAGKARQDKLVTTQAASVARRSKDTGDSGVLMSDLRNLIEEARQSIATAVNVGLTLLYWRIGRRMYTEVLQEQRAEYGDEIVVTVSRQLAAEHGQGFSTKNLQRMVQFAQVFPQEKIVPIGALIRLW